MKTAASNITLVVDAPCPDNDGQPCRIREMDNYGQRTGFLWCGEHGWCVGTITDPP